MKDIKGVVFFDLDGTLLNKNCKIDKEVRDSIKKLKENDIMPVVATGRSIFEVEDILKEAGIETILSMNGQYVKHKGKEIINKTIPSEVCEKILDIAKEKNDVIGFYNSRKIALSTDRDIGRQFYEEIHTKYPCINPESHNEDEVNMVLIISEQTDEAYKNAVPELTFFINSSKSIDTVSKGGSKGQVIKEFLEKVNISGVPTYAFGDGVNDISMFEVVDHPIAMGNATEKLRPYAEYITDDNKSGGIVNGLKKYNLI